MEEELIQDLVESLNKRWGVPFDVERRITAELERNVDERVRLSKKVSAERLEAWRRVQAHPKFSTGMSHEDIRKAIMDVDA